jgi:hypothetical protein
VPKPNAPGRARRWAFVWLPSQVSRKQRSARWGEPSARALNPPRLPASPPERRSNWLSPLRLTRRLSKDQTRRFTRGPAARRPIKGVRTPQLSHASFQGATKPDPGRLSDAHRVGELHRHDPAPAGRGSYSLHLGTPQDATNTPPNRAHDAPEETRPCHRPHCCAFQDAAPAWPPTLRTGAHLRLGLRLGQRFRLAPVNA